MIQSVYSFRLELWWEGYFLNSLCTSYVSIKGSVNAKLYMWWTLSGSLYFLMDCSDNWYVCTRCPDFSVISIVWYTFCAASFPFSSYGPLHVCSGVIINHLPQALALSNQNSAEIQWSVQCTHFIVKILHHWEGGHVICSIVRPEHAYF